MGRRTYYKTQYNRPNMDWVCGRVREGLPCPKGPKLNGRCGGQYECDPVKINGRWRCTRPDPYGGPCDSPSLPDPDFGPYTTADPNVAICCRPAGCVPERSMRAKRRLTAYAMLGLSLGVLIIGISSPVVRDRFISPGRLTVHHQGASEGTQRLMKAQRDDGSGAATSETETTTPAAGEGSGDGAAAEGSGESDVADTVAAASVAPGAGTAMAKQADTLNCRQCHHAFESGETTGVWAVLEPFNWIRAAFDGVKRDPEAERLRQNKLCLTCHEDLDDWVTAPNFAHGLPRGITQAITAKSEASDDSVRGGGALLKLATWTGGVPKTANEEIACATCHREHQGRLHNLKVLNDRQCQTCHVQQFDGFNGAHPEFSNQAKGDDYDYPYYRRQRIYFDHVDHYTTSKFQGNDNAPPAGDVGCAVCHVPDTVGETMQLAPYEKMCATANCHDTNIVTSPSIRLFGNGPDPDVMRDWMRSVDRIEDAESRKEWFGLMAYAGVTSVELNPFVAVQLLEDTPGAVKGALQPGAIATLEKERLGVRDADLATNGPGDLEEGGYFETARPMLQRLLKLENALVAPVSGGDPASPRDAGKTLGFGVWREMGDLPTNVSSRELFGPFEDGQSKSADDLAKLLVGDDVSAAGGWSVSTGAEFTDTGWAAFVDNSLEFAPIVYSAEIYPPAKAFLDFVRSKDDFADWLFGHIQLIGSDWRMRTDADAAVGPEEWATALSSLAAFGALNPASTAAEESADEPAEEPAESETAATAAPQEVTAFMEWFSEPANVRGWLEGTVESWYGLHAPTMVSYRPMRHADPFLKGWLDYSAKHYFDNPMARRVFNWLAGMEWKLPESGEAAEGGTNDPITASQGRCMKCHTVDHIGGADGAGFLRVNWGGKPRRSTFTSFNHAPHLRMQEAVSCGLCHEFNQNAGTFASSFYDGETKDLRVQYVRAASNFKPVEKNLCTECHTPQLAGSNCIVCHKYHVNDVHGLGASASGVERLSRLFTAIPAPGAAPGDAAPSAPPVPSVREDQTAADEAISEDSEEAPADAPAEPPAAEEE